MPDKKYSGCTVVKPLVQEYSNYATIHGINYIFGTFLNSIFDRIIWLAVFISANVLAAYVGVNLYRCGEYTVIFLIILQFYSNHKFNNIMYLL